MKSPIIIINRDQSGKRARSTPMAALYSYQKCKCFYCGRFMRYMSFHPHDEQRREGYTIDHLFPRSLGFSTAGNSVLACRKCNEKKGDRQPTNVEIVRAWELYRDMNRTFIATIIFP